MSSYTQNLKQYTLNSDVSPILQSFLVKSNLSINLAVLMDTLTVLLPKNDEKTSFRSGTIIALKYKNITKGKNDLFKTKNGFKNACHLIMCHTLDKRQKKMVQIKITSVGTFQIVGIPEVDVEKVIYKVFLLLEKLNKNNDIFSYTFAEKEKTAISNKTDNRLEIVIVPILNNYKILLNECTLKKIFGSL